MPNEEIDSLVNKYSSDKRRTSSNNVNNYHQSTSALNYNNNHDDSFGMLDMMNDSQTNEAYPGGDYVQRRSQSKKDKPRRKQRRSTTGGRGGKLSQSSSSLMGRDYDDEFLDFTQDKDNSSSNSPNRRGNLPRQNSASPGTRASVSPSLLDDSDDKSNVLLERGSKYVLPPPPPPEEEQNALLLYSSPNIHDPLSGGPIENFQDEFEDEMDEIEMRDRTANFINLSDLEAKSKRRKTGGCLWKCMKLLCCLIVLTAIVGVVVAVVTTMKNQTVTKIPQSVPKLEARMVGLWCNEGLDLGPGQAATFPLPIPEDCKKACLAAECCWHPTGDYVCTPETRDNCEAYKHECDVMIPHSDPDGVIVPPAPPTLKTTCVPVGPSFTATDICHDICQQAACCWDDTSTVPCDSESWQANCSQYEEFCSFFNDHPHNNNQNGNDEDLPFPVANPDLPVFCDVDQMEQNGPGRCEEGCAVASCCWKMGTVNCASTVPNNMCEPYADACKVLNPFYTHAEQQEQDQQYDANGVEIAIAPAGLSVYCDPSEMEEVSLHICQDKCEQAKCCWSTTAEACPNSVPAALCEPYVENCAILNDLKTYPGGSGSTNEPADGTSNNDNTINDNDEVPQAPADFTIRCSTENIIGSEDGGNILIKCEQECLAAGCCWKPNVELCKDNARCSDYEEPCSIFVGLFSDGSDIDGDATTSGGADNNDNDSSNGAMVVDSTPNNSDVPVAPSDLASTCSPDVLTVDVNNGAGIVECERQCLRGACCWKESSGSSCSGSANCDAYMEPCGNNLVTAIQNLEGHGSASAGTNVEDPAAHEIAKSCSTNDAIFVKTRCENECRPGTCCFFDNMACAAGVDCGIYEPCDVLFRKRHQLRH